MPEKSKSALTTKFTDFKHDRLTFTKYEENERSKGQLIAYPRYNHPKLGDNQALFLQGPWMTIFTYGIPSLGEYYSDDSQRAFIKVPLNLEDPDVKIMVDEFKKVDDVLGSKEFMEENFGKKASKYKYQPIIRESVEDDDGNVKPAYMKLKLDTSWPDGNVKTELYKSELVDGKRKRELVSATTVTDVAKFLSYQTKFKPIFRPVKMWAHNTKMAKPEYGVVFKLLKVEFEPSVSSNNMSSYEGDAFIDDEDDEDEEAPAEVDEPVTVFKSKEKKQEVVEDSDDDEDSDESSDDDDSDSDEPPKKSVVKAKGKAKSAKSSK